MFFDVLGLTAVDDVALTLTLTFSFFDDVLLLLLFPNTVLDCGKLFVKFEEREAVVTVLCDALIDFGFVFVIELVFFFTDVDECLIVDVFFLIDVDDAFGFLIEIAFVFVCGVFFLVVLIYSSIVSLYSTLTLLSSSSSFERFESLISF